jgi:hypothetical protein
MLVVLAGTLMSMLGAAVAADDDLLPPRLPRDQRENLQRFLQAHDKPARYVPADAKLVDVEPTSVEIKNIESTPEKPIKQYLVQIMSHRPVPGQEDVKQVDVYYYRPNPEKGKPGITVRHTVDLTTGKQVGGTDVLVKAHTALSREELADAVALAREKSDPVRDLYKDQPDKVHWEYLQLLINKKQEPHEPGDRVVRLVFTATGAASAPVPVVVNLTKGVVVAAMP